MGVRVNTNKSCPYIEIGDNPMRKIFDKTITLTPKSGRVAGPLANVRPDY